MFKPCPNCGFLVALIAGREASQRCPRCGSALLEDGELPPVDDGPVRAPAPRRRLPDAPQTPSPADAGGDPDAGIPPSPRADGPVTRAGMPLDDVEAAPANRVDPPSVQQPGGRPAVDEHPVPDHVARGRGRPMDGVSDATPPADPAPPSFAARRAQTARRRGRHWPWAVVLPALALLLALQLLLSQRAELAQDARWRPVVETACGVLGCDVPAWRDPRAFAMLARNVRPHPTRDGVLHVTTSLRNEAEWAQPLPVVVLSLSDVDGRVLAARAVAPTDYSRRPATLVEPGDSIDIAFDVREPSPRVVSFDFQLR